MTLPTGGQDEDLDEGVAPGQDEQHSADDWKAPASQAELDKLINKAVARAHQQYKDYGSVKEKAGLYDQLLATTQTDSERAAAEAEERGFNAAMGSTVPRLVTAEFRAAAKGVLDNDALAVLLEDVDLTKYVGDDGEVDLEKIERKIKAVAPKTPPPSFGQGSRGTAPRHVDMNTFIRERAGITPSRG